MYKENDKFYFGKEIFMRDEVNTLSLGAIGLLEKYCSMAAYDRLKNPWITLEDIEKWCSDDLDEIQYYIQEGIQKNYLIRLDEEQAIRLQNDPMNNCWLFE